MKEIAAAVRIPKAILKMMPSRRPVACVSVTNIQSSCYKTHMTYVYMLDTMYTCSGPHAFISSLTPFTSEASTASLVVRAPVELL